MGWRECEEMSDFGRAVQWKTRKRQKKTQVPSVFLLAVAEAGRRVGGGERELEGGCLIRERTRSVTTHFIFIFTFVLFCFYFLTLFASRSG
jgi:hypothetical protein